MAVSPTRDEAYWDVRAESISHGPNALKLRQSENPLPPNVYILWLLFLSVWKFCEPLNEKEPSDFQDGVWKMFSDIPQCRSPEHGISNGMAQHIGIRMAQQSLFKGDIHTP